MIEFLLLVIMQLISLFSFSASIDDADVGSTSTSTASLVRVIDGDTIEVLIDEQRERVRYIGIDTPELYPEKECYGQEALDFNTQLLSGSITLVTDTSDRDRFDRLLRYVYVDDVFINELLVKEGYATALTIPPNTQFAETFQSLEEQARMNGKGLWSVCW